MPTSARSPRFTGITPLDGGGYEVRYTRYGERMEHGIHRRDYERITCDQLLLGAGTFGTTALLLRNRVGLPALGRALGSRFSGNGDLLTFCFGAEGTSEAGQVRLIDPAYGPVITTALRQPDGVDEEGAGRGYYVQEAGFPDFANWLIETAQITASDEARRERREADDREPPRRTGTSRRSRRRSRSSSVRAG